MTRLSAWTARASTLLGLAAALTASNVATADPGPAAQAEIDHLLRYVGSSSCQFVRNGTAYPALEAQKHLSDKLRHARSRISTADDFVRGVASSSSVSGQPYLIRCGEKDVPVGPWLTEELARLRGRPMPTK